jgi:RNA polymerase sigma-70 factor (ECF subfamily)
MAVISALRKGQLQDPEKLAAFVHGTARNLINNELRRQSLVPPLEPLTEGLSQASMVEDLEDADRVRLVHEAVEHLGESDRKILHMTLMEGCKPSEIAAALGLTSEVVRTRKVRAIRKITDILRKKMSRS